MTDSTLNRDLRALFHQKPIGDTFRLSFMANSLVLPVYDEIKRCHGLNRGEYLLVHCLSHLPVMTAQDVARITGRPRNSISRAVHRMLEDGYIARAPDPDDGRQARLTVSGKGRALVEAVTPLFEARQEELFEPLSAEDRCELDRLLTKLTAAAPI
ncbi:MAG: MarR family winged helix-turn-helix transcriptional regulator [Minwuia sp.]|uniref:MarR family winged helix-turn-helix transcriptional regulator n=1 Tax=Minwuia sp. TaxID=2493630 RepID=UPI003A83F5A7